MAFQAYTSQATEYHSLAIVAQLVRALDCGSKGREFESRRSPSFIKVKNFKRLSRIVINPRRYSFGYMESASSRNYPRVN